MATNKSRKRATKFLPRDEVDWARAQRQAEQSAKHAAIPNSKFNPSGTGSRPHYAEKYPAPVPQSGHLAEATHDLHRQAQARRSVGRGLAVAGGAVAVAGGTGYLVHRHNQKQKELASKMLVDPFAKAYPIVEPVPRSIRVAALLPTGRHVGNANDLKHYRITPKGHRQGPFGKGLFGGARKVSALEQRTGALRGLSQVTRQRNPGVMPLRSPGGTRAGVPFSHRPDTFKHGGANPSGAGRGVQMAGRPTGSAPVDRSYGALGARLKRNGNIPSEGKTGRRIA